jgi:hypothetical protein
MTCSYCDVVECFISRNINILYNLHVNTLETQRKQILTITETFRVVNFSIHSI